MAKQRIGVLGGTFDPVHPGHVAIARAAAEAARLNRVLLMPAGITGYKENTEPAALRYQMLTAALRGDKTLVPCPLELERKEPVYTADTLPLLRAQYPEAKFFWITGGDAFLRMRRWNRADELLRAVSVLVCPRPGLADPADLAAEVESVRALGGKAKIIPADIPPIASSRIRAALAEGQDPPELDLCVREYIRVRGLYGQTPALPEAPAWLDQLFAALRPHRFAHSLAVADTARSMAERFGENARKAETAGLIHDCAKHLSLEDMRRLVREENISGLDNAFLESTALLHSVAGAVLARRDYGVTDPEILSAIACHNTGYPGMSRLAMCVCLADSVEPTREPYPSLEEIRALADRSLEKALLLSLERTAEYVSRRGLFLHPRTRDTIAWLKTLPETRE